MKKVILTIMENMKYKENKHYVDHPPKYGLKAKSKKRIAKKLQVDVKQVERWIAGYLNCGKEYFIHGNRGRICSRAISEEKIITICKLYEDYTKLNFSHFNEKILLEMNNINISSTSLTTILINNDFVSPKASRITKRNHRDKTGKYETFNDDEIIDSVLYDVAKPKDKKDMHPTRVKRENFGEEVQMDASDHVWFGKTKSHLHTAIDHSTGIVLGMQFEEQETLVGYYNLFEQILSEYGAPYEIITDNRTVFAYKTKGRQLLENDTLTQFSFACCQLGTNLCTTSIPEAKGQIERLFQTLQDRTINEMELAGVQTIEQANLFSKTYIKEFNSKFAIPINYSNNMFDDKFNSEEINYYLSTITERKVNNAGSITLNKKIYYPINQKSEPVHFPQGTITNIITTKDGHLVMAVKDTKFALVPVEELGQYYCKNKHVFIPPMTHYYKYRSFKKYLKNKKRKETYANVG